MTKLFFPEVVAVGCSPGLHIRDLDGLYDMQSPLPSQQKCLNSFSAFWWRMTLCTILCSALHHYISLKSSIDFDNAQNWHF